MMGYSVVRVRGWAVRSYRVADQFRAVSEELKPVDACRVRQVSYSLRMAAAVGQGSERSLQPQEVRHAVDAIPTLA
jgi:hypothetical protein